MKWTPAVEGQMPEYDTRVLTLAPERYFPVDIHTLRHMPHMPSEALDWWMGDQNFVVSEHVVTHWMPLPSTDTKADMPGAITRLTVIWEGVSVFPALEDELRALFARYGLEWWAQGYDFTSHERDMAFRPIKEQE